MDNSMKHWEACISSSAVGALVTEEGRNIAAVCESRHH